MFSDFYKKFCEETFNKENHLIKFRAVYPPDFNYGYDVVDAIARKEPEKTALVYEDPHLGTGSLTFRDISVLSNKTANVLLQYGIKKGDKLMVVLKNHYEYWYIAIAAHKLGAVLCPVFYMLPEQALIYRIKKADETHIICTPYGDAPKNVRNAAEKCGVSNLFSIREDVEGFISLTREMENASDTFERVQTSAYDPSIIYFTSGTTGMPKAVMHNHIFLLTQIVASRYLLCSEKGVLHLSIGDSGWSMTTGTKFYGPWLIGIPLLIYEYDSFSPEKMLEVLEKHKVNSFMAPPTLYKSLLRAGMDKYDLSELDTLCCGGEPLPVKVFEEVYRQTGIILREGLAQSEASLYIGNLKFYPVKPGSIGKIVPKFNTIIADENGTPVETGRYGEIMIIPEHGGHYQNGIAIGYYKDEQAYEKLWENGLFHTGDFARADEEGYIYYGGRVDDIIKTKAYRVSPFEIESVLIKHPAVYECMVTGIPNEDMGMLIKAFVVPETGIEPSENLKNELMEFANSRLAGYMKIRQLEFADSLEKSTNGKIIHKK